MVDSDHITNLLIAWRGGDQQALEDLMPVVYEELRGICRNYLNRERQNHTLNPTDLVNEVYLRLIQVDRIDWQNRAHFFAVTAQVIRQILISYARKRGAVKRGGDAVLIPLEQAVEKAEGLQVDIVRLDDALNLLAETDPRKARIIELKFFVGLTDGEVAEVLSTSESTVRRELRFAKAWLFGKLKRG